MTFDITNNFSSKKELNFTPISPVDTFNTAADSSLSWGNRSSLPKEETTETIATTNSYNSNNGYGLVDAGKAVSGAAGESPYADAPDLGGNNWGADLVNAPAAWEHGHTGQGIIVAVLDTGVDYNHEDLKNNIWTNNKEVAGNGIDDDGNGYIDDFQGWNFDSSNNNVLDDNSHGTHVSGTIAGENNGIGVTGIAYNSKIMPVKVLDKNGSGSYSNIANGIYYAVNNGANVINLSLGGNSSNDILKSAIEYASSKGVIVVMAAGNNGDSTPSYPARYAYNSGIAVGAVDRNNNLADFSNRSGSQEIKYVTAPGKGIYSTVPNNQYTTYDGTSMAAPHVAGVVALILSANRSLSDSQVREIITSTANNTTPTPAPSQPSNPSPSLPFPFPIDLLPFSLDIGSLLPNIGSLFPLGSQGQSTIQLPPIVLSVGENSLEFRFRDVGTGTQKIANFSYYGENNDKWELRYYDSPGLSFTSVNDGDIEGDELVKKR
ncbi:S8 family peptidase [Trichormus sp. NMC-1]|uniref:S8 family peptidase n=1 Tax=Trichormus sp. NMC-1 TaxID=1853259 RepID=UPI0008DBF299|nr:S8 family peptidase [Trichormus sp. NMC-1]